MQMERDKRTAKQKTNRKTRKRKEPVVDDDIERGGSSKKFQNVTNISDDDDVEKYRSRNEQLWKYFFDENNFKCAD